MKTVICSFLLLFVGFSLQAQGIYYHSMEALLKGSPAEIKEVKKVRLVTTLHGTFLYDIRAESTNGKTIKSLWSYSKPTFYKRDGRLYCFKRRYIETVVVNNGWKNIHEDSVFELYSVGNFFYFKLAKEHPFIDQFKNKAQEKIAQNFEEQAYSSMLFVGANKMTWGLIKKDKIIESLEDIAEISNVGRNLLRHCLNYLEQKAKKESLPLNEVSFSLKEFEDILFKFERGEI